MISRRAFLRTAALAALPLGAGVVAWRDSLAWFVSRASARVVAMARSPEDRLRAHFHYLTFDPAAAAQYVADLRYHNPAFSARQPLGPDIHTQFLLSTDFFQHGADEQRTIHYVGYYDPASTPCHNPLVRFDDGELA
jgi:hypothetical protein